jgi:hypothetical protein
LHYLMERSVAWAQLLVGLYGELIREQGMDCGFFAVAQCGALLPPPGVHRAGVVPWSCCWRASYSGALDAAAAAAALLFSFRWSLLSARAYWQRMRPCVNATRTTPMHTLRKASSTAWRAGGRCDQTNPHIAVAQHDNRLLYCLTA